MKEESRIYNFIIKRILLESTAKKLVPIFSLNILVKTKF